MNQTCSTESMKRLEKQIKYVISGNEEPVTVGDHLQVTCIEQIQLFTRDIWDGNSTDNILKMKCRSDRSFDVPNDDDLPECLAQCSAEKPTPPEDFKIALDTERTSPDNKLWEREELW